jgi:hypothetical protein
MNFEQSTGARNRVVDGPPAYVAWRAGKATLFPLFFTLIDFITKKDEVRFCSG